MNNISNFFPRLPKECERVIDEIKYEKLFKSFWLACAGFNNIRDSFEMAYDNLPELYETIDKNYLKNTNKLYNILIATCYLKNLKIKVFLAFQENKKDDYFGASFQKSSKNCEIYLYFDGKNKFSYLNCIDTLVHEFYHSYKKHNIEEEYNKDFETYACSYKEYQAEGCSIGYRIRNMHRKDFEKLKKEINKKNFKVLKRLGTGDHITGWKNSKLLYQNFILRVKNEIKLRDENLNNLIH